MAPKKRVVKTARKTPTPRSRTRSQSQSPLPDPTSTPPSASAACNETPTADETPAAVETPAPVETPAAVETPTNAPADVAAEGSTSSPCASPAAADETPVAQLPAAPEEARPAIADTLVEEPAVTETPAAETAAPDPAAPEASEPTASETPAAEPSEAVPKPGTKTTRVRKVVKKKIIKRRVPKASLAVADNAEKAEAVAKETPVQQPEPGNPSSQAAIDETPAQLEPMDAENLDSRDKNEEPLEQVNLDSGESKEASLEQRDLDSEEYSKAREAVELPQPEAAAAEIAARDEEAGMSERQKRRRTEIFIGGLDRDAKEEDLRKVFGAVGEIVEVRMMMDSLTGKNKGYAFLRYREAAQAKKAVVDFSKVEICGKLCGAAALEGNDTIFLGNIDKKWKKEDLIKLLQDIGIEKIDTVTVMVDPNNIDSNRGFAFLELETNRDAQIAYKKLQKKDAFGKGRNIKVAWAEPLNDPDEEEMQQVKSVYVEGIPFSWDEAKVRESFKKFGEIERIVLARNIPSAKRKDFAFVNYTVREAALSCIESFEKEELTDNGSKVNVKVSLAKPVRKGKQSKGGSKSSNKDKEKTKAVQQAKVNVSSNKGKAFKGAYSTSAGEMKSSMTNELLNVLREQAAWKQGQIGYARAPAAQDYAHALPGGKRPYSALGDDSIYSDLRAYPRARVDSSVLVTSSSYGALPHGVAGSSLPYYQRQGGGYATGSVYGSAEQSNALQTRQGAPPYGSNQYSRYY